MSPHRERGQRKVVMVSSRSAEAPRQHGVKGAYVGGDWVDIGGCVTTTWREGTSSMLCPGGSFKHVQYV